MAIDVAELQVTVNTGPARQGFNQIRADSRTMASGVTADLRQVATATDGVTISAASLVKQEAELTAKSIAAAKALRDFGLSAEQINQALPKMGLRQVAMDADKVTAATERMTKAMLEHQERAAAATERMTKALLDQQQAARQMQQNSANGFGYAGFMNAQSRGGSGSYATGLTHLGQVREAAAAAEEMGRKAAAAQAEAAKAATQAAAQAAAAAPNYGKLQGALQSVALSAAGIPGPVGNAARALSGLTLTGGKGVAAMVGLSAAVALVAAAYNKAQEPLRKAREETDRFRQAGVDAFRELQRSSQAFKASELKRYNDELVRANTTVAAIRKELTAAQASGNRGLASILEQNLRGAIELRGQWAMGATQAGVNAIDDALQRAEKAKQLARELRREQAEVAQFERQNTLTAAEMSGDRIRIEEARAAQRRAGYQEQLAEIEHLGAEERARLERAQQVAESLAAQKDLIESIALATKQITPLTLGFGFLGDYDADQANQKRRRDEANRARFVLAPQGLTPETRPGRPAGATGGRSTEQIAREAEAERQRVRDILLATTDGVADLSQQLFGLDAATANAIRAVGSLAAAISDKNPAGIIAAGVSFVGSIFGDGGKKEREEARKARAAQLDDINRFIEGIRPQGTALEELARSYQELYDQGKRLGLGNHELARLTQAFANEQSRLLEVERERNTQLQDDLRVRGLLAEGRDREAEALRAQLEAQREYAGYLLDGYDAVSLATLAHIQAIEAEAEARRIATEEARKALELTRQRRDLGADFAERSQRLAGNTFGADVAGINRQLERQRDWATDLLTDGLINEADLRDWIALLEGEAQQAVRNLTEAWNAQVDAAQRLHKEMVDDLEVRRLAALGYDDQAEALTRQLDQERELQQLRDRGAGEELLAQYRQLQAMEDAKTAAEKLADSLAKLAEKARQESYAFDELTGRRLRVQGLTSAADEASMFATHRRQIDDAIGEGRSDGYLVELRAIQALERDRLRADREAEQLKAFQSAADHNFSLSNPFAETSRTSTTSAIGITTQDASRITGALNTGVVLWSQQLEVQRTMASLLAVIARAAGGGDDGNPVVSARASHLDALEMDLMAIVDRSRIGNVTNFDSPTGLRPRVYRRGGAV